MAKFKDALDKAARTDSSLKDKYQNHREGIALLSKSEAELYAAISIAGSKRMQMLCELMKEIHTLQEERETIEKVYYLLSSNWFHFIFISTQALKEVESTSTDFSDSEILQQVSRNIEQQEDVTSRIVTACNLLAQEEAQKSATKEERLKELADAYGAFMELEASLDGHAEVFGDLTKELAKIQSEVRDFVSARRTKREELKL